MVDSRVDPPESNVVIRAEIYQSRLYVDKQDQGDWKIGESREVRHWKIAASHFFDDSFRSVKNLVLASGMSVILASFSSRGRQVRVPI